MLPINKTARGSPHQPPRRHVNSNGLVGVSCPVTRAVAKRCFLQFLQGFCPPFQLAIARGISSQPHPQGEACTLHEGYVYTLAPRKEGRRAKRSASWPFGDRTRRVPCPRRLLMGQVAFKQGTTPPASKSPHPDPYCVS